MHVYDDVLLRQVPKNRAPKLSGYRLTFCVGRRISTKMEPDARKVSHKMSISGWYLYFHKSFYNYEITQSISKNLRMVYSAKV